MENQGKKKNSGCFKYSALLRSKFDSGTISRNSPNFNFHYFGLAQQQPNIVLYYGQNLTPVPIREILKI